MDFIQFTFLSSLSPLLLITLPAFSSKGPHRKKRKWFVRMNIGFFKYFNIFTDTISFILKQNEIAGIRSFYIYPGRPLAWQQPDYRFDATLTKREYFYDNPRLNTTGAALFTEKLVSDIKADLKKINHHF